MADDIRLGLYNEQIRLAGKVILNPQNAAWFAAAQPSAKPKIEILERNPNVATRTHRLVRAAPLPKSGL